MDDLSRGCQGTADPDPVSARARARNLRRACGPICHNLDLQSRRKEICRGVALDIVTPMPAWRPSDTCLFGLGPIAPITMGNGMGAGDGRWTMCAGRGGLGWVRHTVDVGGCGDAARSVRYGAMQGGERLPETVRGRDRQSQSQSQSRIGCAIQGKLRAGVSHARLAMHPEHVGEMEFIARCMCGPYRLRAERRVARSPALTPSLPTTTCPAARLKGSSASECSTERRCRKYVHVSKRGDHACAGTPMLRVKQATQVICLCCARKLQSVQAEP